VAGADDSAEAAAAGPSSFPEASFAEDTTDHAHACGDMPAVSAKLEREDEPVGLLGVDARDESESISGEPAAENSVFESPAHPTNQPETLVAVVPTDAKPRERWGVTHGLPQSHDLPDDQMVSVDLSRSDGLILARRPSSKAAFPLRPENVRVLLERYERFAAGDSVDLTDGGEATLLGFDAATQRWAGVGVRGNEMLYWWCSLDSILD
jgi:hypothetical protein